VVWGEGKQDVLLKECVMLIAVFDGVAVSANGSNIEINFF
jgi:hypothetical protein